MGGNLYQIYFGGGEEPANSLDLSVPAGLTVTHMALDGNKLAVHLIGPEGAEIRIVNLRRKQPLTRSMIQPPMKKMAWAIIVMARHQGTTQFKLRIYTFVTQQDCMKSVPAVKRKHRLFFKGVDCVSLAPKPA